jgi:hypothetical protein
MAICEAVIEPCTTKPPLMLTLDMETTPPDTLNGATEVVPL